MRVNRWRSHASGFKQPHVKFERQVTVYQQMFAISSDEICYNPPRLFVRSNMQILRKTGV